MARSRHDDDDDYDDRPRRRHRDDYDDEDDYDDRPRRRRKKKPAGPPVGLIVAGVVGGGVLLLLVGAVAVFLYWSGERGAVAQPAGFGPMPQQPQPPFVPPTPPPLTKGGPAAAPPKADPPAQGENALTLTAARRGTDRLGKPTLEIDYTLTGGMVVGRVVVKIKRPTGEPGEANLFGGLGLRPGERSGTLTLEQFGPFGDGFQGSLEIWVERKIGRSGTRISNTITLN